MTEARELSQHLEFLKYYEGLEVVLVTLISTRGSVYQNIGSKKLVTCDGQSSSGQISGGCLEGYINELATGVSSVHFETISTDSEEDRLFGFELGCRGELGLKFEKISTEAAKKIIQSEYLKTPKVYVFGAGIDVIPMHEILQVSGLRFEFYDYRRDFVDQFPGQATFCSEPTIKESTEEEGPRFIFLMSHNYNYDLGALAFIVKNKIDFELVGILGPHSRTSQMKHDLKTIHDVDLPADLDKKICGKVGLPNLGKGPYAIALSIMGLVQQQTMQLGGYVAKSTLGSQSTVSSRYQKERGTDAGK